MARSPESARSKPSVAEEVQRRIHEGGERVWRLDDFRDLSLSAAAQALSRLTRAREIRRLSKGVYYRSRRTALGESRPNPAGLQRLASGRAPIFPAGLTAANFLGFTTQNRAGNEVSTTAASLPRKLVGEDTVVHARRPASWNPLSQEDAALLEFLRDAGKTSDLTEEETVRRTLRLLSESGRYRRLVGVASGEPPRVRALLGALGEELESPKALRDRLRTSLNPLSRFEFGPFARLPSARSWQASGKH